MSVRTTLTAVLIGAFLAVLLALSAWNARAIPDEEIARRVRESRPTWQNYPEDIKAHLGARLAAEWEGEPIAVEQDGAELRATFRLEGPWAERKHAVPLLMEEPSGGVRQNDGALFPEEASGEVIYVFTLPESSQGMPLPWIRMKHPRGERRIALTNGAWRASL